MTKDKLRQTIKSLPLLYGPQLPLSWQARRMELRQNILNKNPNKFQTWPVITSTMITDPEYQNYHLDQWEDKTGSAIEILDIIVEFGGGYGAMIEMCYERGFRGTYYNYDFPEMMALQEFYLSGKDIPLPHSMGIGSKRVDLFIAINSFDEVEIDIRDTFLDDFYFQHCLVRYSHQYDGVDNQTYFNQFDGQHWTDKNYTNHGYWVR